MAVLLAIKYVTFFEQVLNFKCLGRLNFFRRVLMSWRRGFVVVLFTSLKEQQTAILKRTELTNQVLPRSQMLVTMSIFQAQWVPAFQLACQSVLNWKATFLSEAVKLHLCYLWSNTRLFLVQFLNGMRIIKVLNVVKTHRNKSETFM